MSEGVKEKQQVRYWQKRSLQHLPEMRAAKAAGLFPKKEGWRNVPEHGLVESQGIDVMAEAFSIPNPTRRHMESAGNLHDVGKRRQIELYNQQGPSGARKAEKEQEVFLENSGFPSEVIRLTKFMGGLSPLEMVKDPKADKLELKDDLDLPVLICHYVDDITLHDQIVPLKDRIAYVKERYKVEDEEGVKIIGRPYSDVQFEVARQIERKLAKLLGIEPPEKLPEWIRDKILERVEHDRLEEVCVEAAHAAFNAHEQLGDNGKREKATNAFGETTLVADWECEEAVINVFKKHKIPVKIISEEHDEVTIGENPQYLAVLDGLDGTYQYKRDEIDDDRRYGTMFAIFKGTDPKYEDAIAAFIMEHPTRKLFFASKGKGAYVSEDNHKKPVVASSKSNLDQRTRVFVDEGYEYNKSTFSTKLQDYKPRCTFASSRYYADLTSGHADIVCECTRKGNLELATAYLLVREAGGAMIMEDGANLGDQTYLTYGQGRDEYKGIISAATRELADEVRQLVKSP